MEILVQVLSRSKVYFDDDRSFTLSSLVHCELKYLWRKKFLFSLFALFLPFLLLAFLIIFTTFLLILFIFSVLAVLCLLFLDVNIIILCRSLFCLQFFGGGGFGSNIILNFGVRHFVLLFVLFQIITINVFSIYVLRFRAGVEVPM